MDSKTVVGGAVERGGRIKAKTIPNRTRTQVIPLVLDTIEPGATVYTDDASIYWRLDKRGFNHASVNHSAKVYADGDVHTNTIEGLKFSRIGSNVPLSVVVPCRHGWFPT